METKGIDNIFSGMTPVSDYESDTEVIADLAGFQVTKAELFSHTREPAITIWENRIKFNMVFLTGDIHGVPWDLCRRCKQYGIGAGDIVVLLGDVGANYRGGEVDKSMKAILDMAGPTFLCIHGNHEMRPWNVSGYIRHGIAVTGIPISESAGCTFYLTRLKHWTIIMKRTE